MKVFVDTSFTQLNPLAFSATIYLSLIGVHKHRFIFFAFMSVPARLVMSSFIFLFRVHFWRGMCVTLESRGSLKWRSLLHLPLAFVRWINVQSWRGCAWMTRANPKV